MNARLAGFIAWCTPALVWASDSGESFRRVLAPLPADPLAVLYTQDARAILDHPVVKFAFDGKSPPPLQALSALTELFDGPFALAVTGSPVRPDLLGVIVSAKVSTDQDAFFQALDHKLVATLNRLDDFCAGGSLALRRVGDLAFLDIAGPVPLRLTFAHRDGYVLGSTHRAVLDDWLSAKHRPDDEAAATFRQSDDFKRFLPGRDSAPELLAYVNVRPLLPLLAISWPEPARIVQLLGLNGIEAVGLTAEQSPETRAVRLTVCKSNDSQGALALLQPTTTDLGVAAVFPTDAVFAVGGKVQDADAALEAVKGILDAVDPDIVEEFEAERAEFLGDYDFDIQSEFLVNLSAEWMLAGQADAGGLARWMFALRVRDRSLLESHLAALVRAFDLGFEVGTHREHALYTPRSTRFRATYALLDEYWLIGEDADDVSTMIDAWLDKKSLHDAPAFRRARATLTDASHFVFLNIAQVAAAASPDNGKSYVLGRADEATAAFLKHLAGDKDAAVTLALRPSSDNIELRLEAQSRSGGRRLWENLVAGVVMPTLSRSRQIAQRQVSLSNVQGIVQAAMITACDRKGKWPPSLTSMLESGALSLENLRSPYDGTAPRSIATADAESFYLYRPVGTVPNPAETVAVAEREIVKGEGAVFGFADGHAEFVPEPRASELLAELRRGQEP